jgi:hypothetical protein
MKFTLAFRLLPPGVFGLPDGAKTVLPGRPGTHHSPMLHQYGLDYVLVGVGTLPEYRPEENAVHLSVQLGQVDAAIDDNVITMRVAAESARQAYQVATEALDRFLQHLSITQGTAFSYESIFFEDENGSSYPLPRFQELLSVVSYNLTQLTDRLRESATLCTLSDERLDRALSYYEHSIFLFANRARIADPLSRHHQHLIASVFLSLWKSLSVIVGDPARRGDRYQKRYRDLGFPPEFKKKMDRLKELRDDYDVAHYSLDASRLQQVEASYSEAQKIVAEALGRYRDHLNPPA